MYCIIKVKDKECGFEFDPDNEGTPSKQHKEAGHLHIPVWSIESDF